MTAQLGFFPNAPAPKRPKRSASNTSNAKKTSEKQTRKTEKPERIAPQTPPAEPAAHIAEERAIPFLRSLNQQQRDAVECVDSSLIIAAGPGTGKTRTLTHRIAYLITEKHVLPEQILAITFTNKAAEEMANRLEHLMGADVAKRLVIKTFHAFCAMILRKDAEHAGLSPIF